MAEPVRLQRFLAAAGVAARRKAETMIADGRVTVNGAVVRVLGTKIDPTHDSITVDGQAVTALDHFYVLLNKPKGCITAVSDDRGRPTVMDYLPNTPVPVKPVGRLDFYTEGVLLLTNDGELAARLLSAANHVPKTYHAKVHGHVTPEQLTRLRAGVELEDGTVTQPAEVALLPSESKHSWVALTIFEGKYHQVHRMFEALGFRVDKLQRVAFANLTFHHLRVGDARELTQLELNELRDMVGLDHGAVARGRWRADREDTDGRRRARAKARAEAEAALLGTAPGAGFDERDDDGDPDGDDRSAAPNAREHRSGGGERSFKRRGDTGGGERGRGGAPRDDRSAARSTRGSSFGSRAPAPRGGRGAEARGGGGGARDDRSGGGRDERSGPRDTRFGGDPREDRRTARGTRFGGGPREDRSTARGTRFGGGPREDRSSGAPGGGAPLGGPRKGRAEGRASSGRSDGPRGPRMDGPHGPRMDGPRGRPDRGPATGSRGGQGRSSGKRGGGAGGARRTPRR